MTTWIQDLSVLKGKTEIVCSRITLSSSHQIQTSTADGLPSLQFFSIIREWRWEMEKKELIESLQRGKKKSVHFHCKPTENFYNNISWKYFSELKSHFCLVKIIEWKCQPKKDRETMSKMKHHQVSLILILTVTWKRAKSSNLLKVASHHQQTLLLLDPSVS